MLFENAARPMVCPEYILLVFRRSAADGDGILDIEEPVVIQVFYGTLPSGLSIYHQTSLLLGTRA